MGTGIENANSIIKTLPTLLDVPQPDFKEVLKKIRAEKSLKEYVQQSWHIIERKKPLSWNWHLDVQCEHLEQVTATYIVKSGINGTIFEYGKGSDKKTDGYIYDANLIAAINYLWFNLPPRSTKSTIISVIWPTWVARACRLRGSGGRKGFHFYDMFLQVTLNNYQPEIVLNAAELSNHNGIKNDGAMFLVSNMTKIKKQGLKIANPAI